MGKKRNGFVGQTPVCNCGFKQRMKYIGMNSQGHVFECVQKINKRRFLGCGRRVVIEHYRPVEAPKRITEKPIDDTLPHGVVPTLDEVGKPLGYVSGYHIGPGPHFPWHDTRRIYQK